MSLNLSMLSKVNEQTQKEILIQKYFCRTINITLLKDILKLCLNNPLLYINNNNKQKHNNSFLQINRRVK